MLDLKEDHNEELVELSQLLKMEITEKTDQTEIAAKLTDDVLAAIKTTKLLSRTESLGASKVRSIRVIYASIVTIIYNRIVQAHPERIIEIIPYVEGRIRDKDKRIRQYMISFVFRNVQVLKSKNINMHIITKTIIDLLKNKNKQIRLFYLKQIKANISEFSEMLAARDVKYLINTFAIVCECYLQERRPIIGFIKIVLSICARLKQLGKLHLVNVFPLFEICNFSHPEIMPLLKVFYKRCEKEVSNPGYIQLIEDNRKENMSGYIYVNLLALLQYGVNSKFSIFEKYTEEAHNIEEEETKLHVFKVLKESPYNKNPKMFLEKIKEIFSAPQKKQSNGYWKVLLTLYLVYAEEGQLSLEEFTRTIMDTFKKERSSKNAILSFLDKLLKDLQSKEKGKKENTENNLHVGTPSTLNPSTIPTAREEASVNYPSEVFSFQNISTSKIHLAQNSQNISTADALRENENSISQNDGGKSTKGKSADENKNNAQLLQAVTILIREILHYLVANKEEELETFLNYFNPFEYAQNLPLYSITNTVTFYSVLWYMHTLKQTTILNGEQIPSDVQIHRIVHSDFDISLEFYSVLCILSETAGSHMQTLRNEMFTQISVYLETILHSVRDSREYLLSNYTEISCSIDGIIKLLDAKHGMHKIIHPIVKHNISTIVPIILYLLNSPNTLKNMQIIKEYACNVYIRPADTETAKKYGIISDKTARKYEKLLDCTLKEPPATEIDLSSVTEHSISTNLDTNIIEGMSKIDDNK
ncbi:hypothetical protein NEIG_01719 [Nematocida sp. ERTm5]|nr:hypothetical protein NEIG_01719 [Nematocida sp. ERTm5]